MCYTFLRTSETGAVTNAVAVTKKYRNIGSFWWGKNRRQSSGVMHPEEEKDESEKETNPLVIFRATHFSKKYMIFVFINDKKVKK